MATRQLSFTTALREALFEEMAADPRVIIMGEDVAVYGGVYKVSQGLLERFGPERVRDTPISEAAIVGAGIGAAIQGLRPVVEIMYADFIPISLDQIVNQASLMYFVSGGTVHVPLVIRTQGGSGSYAGPQHSKSLEAWFIHIPGLKVIAPSTPADGKGLLKAAIRDDNPVIFYEHKLLYRTVGPVSDGADAIPLGRAAIKRPGGDVTVVAWSRMVLEALKAADVLAEDGLEAEVVDLRSLCPMDEETVFESVRKTGRAVVVQEAWRTGGFGAEVASRIQEQCFDHLDGPVLRVAGQDAPIPFSPALEKKAAPDAAEIAAAARRLCRGSSERVESL
jgi:pyruvate/2-oxoglutarate/acetoin dehydrogenase E1 component